MLANVKMKKAMKSTVFRCLTGLNRLIPKDDSRILLYSGNLGIRHNLKPVLEALIQGGYDKKYRILCGVEDRRYFGTEPQVRYVTKLGAIRAFLRSGHVFYSAGQIPIKPSKDQMVIHMNHGTSDLKTMGKLSNIDNGDEFFFTYMLVPSELYVPIAAREYDCPEANIRVCGEPMTDDLFRPGEPYDLGDFDKVILWMPTFRQSSYLNYSDSSAELLPMFPPDTYEELNDTLKALNYKLIVKLHTAQDTASLQKTSFSNLEILTNDAFNARGYEIYKLMPQTDLLLGDYSSASLQYLLLDKPVFFVVPDMEEYKKKRGFCFAEPERYMPGPLIRTRGELYDALARLKRGEDPYVQDRLRVKNAIFRYQDGNNTRRVLELSGLKP